jgi:hypothetical protein
MPRVKKTRVVSDALIEAIIKFLIKNKKNSKKIKRGRKIINKVLPERSQIHRFQHGLMHVNEFNPSKPPVMQISTPIISSLPALTAPEMIKLIKGAELTSEQKKLLKAAEESADNHTVVVYNPKTKKTREYNEIDYYNALKPPAQQPIITDITEPQPTPTQINTSSQKKPTMTERENAKFHLDSLTKRELEPLYLGADIKNDLSGNPSKDEMINYLIDQDYIKKALYALINSRRNSIHAYGVTEEAINKHNKIVGSGEMNDVIEKSGIMYGDPLTNIDIDEMMAPYVESNDFAGTYAVNTLKNINLPAPLSFITNTLPLSKKMGHWVAVYVTDNDVEYYDPFGRPPDKKMKQELKKLLDRSFSNEPRKKLQFKINMVQDQSTDSMNCGWFAIRFLLDRYNGKKFIDATGFNPHGEKNIKIMQKYYKTFGSI